MAFSGDWKKVSASGAEEFFMAHDPKPENVEKLAEKRKLAEAAALEPKEKRGRGRPKGSTKAKGRGRPRKIVSDPEADDEENSEAKQNKGRGRPEKVSDDNSEPKKKGRGRPKKVVEEREVEEIDDEDED